MVMSATIVLQCSGVGVYGAVLHQVTYTFLSIVFIGIGVAYDDWPSNICQACKNNFPSIVLRNMNITWPIADKTLSVKVCSNAIVSLIIKHLSLYSIFCFR